MGEEEQSSSARKGDPRLELVDRIVATSPFEKATRLQALLRFIVEEAIEGKADELSESNIGQQVFGKGPEYSPLTDSSVRVQARQLRLKLHEYFDGPGRDESLVLEIPKGSYVPSFRSMAQEKPALPVESGELTVPVVAQRPHLLPWILFGLMSTFCLYLIWAAFVSRSPNEKPPWPLTSVFEDHRVTRMILADSAYQIASTASGATPTLDEYLRTKPRDEDPIRAVDTLEMRTMHALTGGTFTSFADAVLVSSVSKTAGRYKLDLEVKSARDLDPRDLDSGNFILVGSKSSNPWVGLYESKLNFQEGDIPGHPGLKCFLNRHPQGNERGFYQSGSPNNDVREDYADVAVIRGIGDRGSVMIVQGLRHEGTEAVGRMLEDPELSSTLQHAFQRAGGSLPKYFEAILAVKSVAGIPHVSQVVAMRAY